MQQAEREKQFGAATNAAWAAFQAGNFTNAIAEADKALAISPDNPAAKKLKDDAQRQLELANAAQEKDQKFLAAMAEGKSAFEGKDYARAIVQASVALELKPNHPSATKLKDDAQRQLELVNAAKASEQKYQTAMTGAKSAFDEKDYVKAITCRSACRISTFPKPPRSPGSPSKCRRRPESPLQPPRRPLRSWQRSTRSKGRTSPKRSSRQRQQWRSRRMMGRQQS